jgi:hypothetical protein
VYHGNSMFNPKSRPMRHKTYLSSEQQWDRSVRMLASRRKLFVDAHRLGIDLGLGRIAGAHRLFRPGDVVFVLFTSWKGDRCRVAAVSSKGYAVFRFLYAAVEGQR